MNKQFMSLYDQYFDDVYRYVFFKTNSHWDTDDLVSDIFKKAFEKYTPAIENPKPWLFSIARNTIIDFYRKKKDIASSDELDQYMYPGCFELDLEKNEQLNCLKKSLSTLPKEDLEFVNLRYFSGLKYKEIGELTGKSEDSVKMRLSRIIKKLKEMISLSMEAK